MFNDANYVDRRSREDLRCEGPRNSNFPTVQALAPPGLSFRSAAEAQLDSSTKFRQLPCKTLISIGTCPYGERCVFLHDPRLVCHLSHSISRLKNREDSAVDSFFWPLAANDSFQGKKNDHNFRPYSVPAPRNDQYRLHDQALYSLWMHYVEFCRITAKAKKTPRAPKMAPLDLPVNIFTQRSRLPVFQLLSSSNGCPISPDQFRFATFERIRAMNGGVVEQPPSVITTRGRMHTPAMKAASAMPLKPIHSSPTGVTARLSFGGGDATVSAAAQAARYAHELQQQQQQQAHAQVPALREAAAAATYYASCASSAVLPATATAAKAAVPAVPGSDSLGTSSGFTSFSSGSSSGSAGQVGASNNNLFDDIPLVAEEEEGDEEGAVGEGEKEESVAGNKHPQGQQHQHQWSARRTMAAAGAMRTQSLKQ